MANSRNLSTLAIIREQSDYSEFYIASAAESFQQIEIAQEIIESVKEYLQGQGIDF